MQRGRSGRKIGSLNDPKDFEKEIAAKRPHLEASFGSQRGDSVYGDGDEHGDEFDEFADHGDSF